MRGMPTSLTVTLAFPSDSLNSIPRSFRLFDTQLNTTVQFCTFTNAWAA